MKVLVLCGIGELDEWTELLNKLNQRPKLGIEFLAFKADDKDNINKYLPEVEAAIIDCSQFHKEELDQAKKLKLVQFPFTGVDSLDFDLYKQYPNISVCISHMAGVDIAEHAFAFILALAKRTLQYDDDIKNDRWFNYMNNDFNIRLQGKNIGILGFGSIGEEVAKIAYRFGMNVYAIKRNIKSIDRRKHLEFIGEMKDMEKVIKYSDFILLSMPLTKETKGLIGEKEFRLMKGKYFINVCRGKIVDEKALYNSLKNNGLKGAGLDVFNDEPLGDSPLKELNNVILSPHIACNTDRLTDKTAELVFDNIKRVYFNKEPISKVDLELGY